MVQFCQTVVRFVLILLFLQYLPNPLLVSDPLSQCNTNEQAARRVSERRAGACLLAGGVVLLC